MLNPTLLKACAAGNLEGVKLTRIEHLLIDTAFFDEGRLRWCIPLIIIANLGIALPDGEILRQLKANCGTEDELIDMAGLVQISKPWLDFQVSQKG